MSQSAAAGLDDSHNLAQGAAHAEHTSFIKTPQQLLVVLFLSFVVPIVGILLLVYLVLGEYGVDPIALEPKAVAARLQPVGSVEVIDVNAPKVFKTGDEVVKTVCAACHTTGAANAPKIGDKAAWAPRLRSGLNAMMEIAIKGKGAMPARGGVPDLSDYEIARSIVVMANQSGGNLKEPPPPAADAKALAPAPAGAKAATPTAEAKKAAPAAKK